MDILQQDFENDNIIKVDPNDPFVVKLNMRSIQIFSMENQEKAYDIFVYDTMTRICNDLYVMAKPNTIYYSHDEILLFFIGSNNFIQQIQYDLQRIVSILSSFASARINYYMENLDLHKYPLITRSKLRAGNLHFYGKGFSVKQHNLASYLFNKTSTCIFASLSQLIKYYLHKDIVPVRTDMDKWILELSNHGVYWDDLDQVFCYGTFVKERCDIMSDYVPESLQTKYEIADINLYIQEYDEDFILQFVANPVYWHSI